MTSKEIEMTYISELNKSSENNTNRQEPFEVQYNFELRDKDNHNSLLPKSLISNKKISKTLSFMKLFERENNIRINYLVRYISNFIFSVIFFISLIFDNYSKYRTDIIPISIVYNTTLLINSLQFLYYLLRNSLLINFFNRYNLIFKCFFAYNYTISLFFLFFGFINMIDETTTTVSYMIIYIKILYYSNLIMLFIENLYLYLRIHF